MAVRAPNVHVLIKLGVLLPVHPCSQERTLVTAYSLRFTNETSTASITMKLQIYRILKFSIVIQCLQVLIYLSNMIMRNMASNIWGTSIYCDTHYQIICTCGKNMK